MRSINKIDVDSVRFATDTDVPTPVMVCSHERSGTHFLINSIAKNSCFRNDPHLNFDFMPLGSFLNFYDRNSVKAFFCHLAEKSCASIVKSHFAAQFFFDDDNNFMLNHICKTLYIVRNPVDVMLSYHRFINYVSWHEGPKLEPTIDFLNAAPEGRMLRYQGGQIGTILERWKVHLLAWLDAATENQANVLTVKYQDLDRVHEVETKKVLSFIGIESPDFIIRPDRVVRTTYIPPNRVVSFAEREQIRKSIVEKIGYVQAIENLFPELYS